MTPEQAPVSWREFTNLREYTEREVRKLDDQKADSKDVAALTKSVDGLSSLLTWFIALVIMAIGTFTGLIFALIQYGGS